jgi:hypothetical protein
LDEVEAVGWEHDGDRLKVRLRWDTADVTVWFEAGRCSGVALDHPHLTRRRLKDLPLGEVVRRAELLLREAATAADNDDAPLAVRALAELDVASGQTRTVVEIDESAAYASARRDARALSQLQETPEPRRGRPSTPRYRLVASAAVYVLEVGDAGNRASDAYIEIGRLFGVGVDQAEDYVAKARADDFMTGTMKGRAGGSLTERGRRYLANVREIIDELPYADPGDRDVLGDVVRRAAEAGMLSPRATEATDGER